MNRTCDTSVLVSALLPWHPGHTVSRDALTAVTSVPAHVLLECYSVLTRLPAPQRIAPADAVAAITAIPFEPLSATPGDMVRLVEDLARAGMSGGAAYDGLIASVAAGHGLVLLTRDQRARRTYELLGARYEFVG